MKNLIGVIGTLLLMFTHFKLMFESVNDNWLVARILLFILFVILYFILFKNTFFKEDET